MKFLKILFNFYINASLHVSLAVYALLRITELYYNLPHHKVLSLVIFFGTVTGYNFIKYAGIAKLYHRSLTENLKVIQLFSLGCFVLLLYYMSQLSIKILLYFIPIGLLTLFYAVPITKGFTKSLRNVPAAKIWVIALVWAISTVMMPIIAVQKVTDIKIILLCVQRFLFVTVLTIPFDIRDLPFDKRSLQTIPQLLGVARTKKFGFVLLALTMVIEFYITPSFAHKTAFVIIFIVLLFLLQRAKTKQSKYYASFWVEGLPIFWMCLLFLILQ